MNIGVCIQSRCESSRLPFKAFLPIGGVPSLQLLINRLDKLQLNTTHSFTPILTTYQSSSTDYMLSNLNLSGFCPHISSFDDVLTRYYEISISHDFDYIVRVCGDSPLTDPSLITELVDNIESSDSGYLFNNRPSSTYLYPDSLGAEIISTHLISKLHYSITDPYLREHISIPLESYIDYSVQPKVSPTLRSTFSFELNTISDLLFLNSLFSAGLTHHSSAPQILSISNSLND